MATLTARCDLPVSAHAPRDAQAFALLTVRAWRSEVSRENLVLLVDELASAVQIHADDEHTLVLELIAHDSRRLTVCLADGSAILPTIRDLAAGTEPLGAPDRSGNGSPLRAALSVLATRWGHEPYLDGRRVWFEVAADLGRGGLRSDAPDLGWLDDEGQWSGPDDRVRAPVTSAAALTQLDARLGRPALRG